MPEKEYNYDLTEQLLIDLRVSALKNAGSLLEEACLLEQAEYWARTYFLALAAIEEIGKAVIAFQALGRDYKNEQVSMRIKRSAFSSHERKQEAAFIPIILGLKRNDSGSIDQEDLMDKIKMIVALKSSREASMYVGIKAATGRVHEPSKVVSEDNGRDCLRWGVILFQAANKFINETEPYKTNATEDAVFSMASNTVLRVTKDENFWRYFITKYNGDPQKYSEAVIKYQNRKVL